MSRTPVQDSATVCLTNAAEQLLLYLYERYQQERKDVASCVHLARNLPLTEFAIEEAATELSVGGYIELRRRASGASVRILDEGKVEAARLRRRDVAGREVAGDGGFLRRALGWCARHVFAKILAGLILAGVLAWIGLR